MHFLLGRLCFFVQWQRVLSGKSWRSLLRIRRATVASSPGRQYIPLCEIEEGSVDVKEPDLASLYLSIDPLKIGQVIRNLITNVVKFTPSDKTITVTLREATAADLAVAESLAGTGKISTQTSKDKPSWVKLSSYPRYWGYGSGYQENRTKLFGKFSSSMPRFFRQFDLNSLSVFTRVAS